MEQTSELQTPSLKAQSLSCEDPWNWLRKGWTDVWRDPMFSLGYGSLFVIGGLGINYYLLLSGLSAAIPVAIGAFTLVGPLMAVGLYELSRRHEAGESYSLMDIVLVKTKSPIHIAYIGFVIMFGLLVWVRIAIMIYALFASSSYLPITDFMQFVLETPAGLSMLVVGTIIGGGIALTLFAMCVFSIPMLMDRKMDAAEAVVRSIIVVKENPGVMLQWAWMVVFLVAVGIMTAFLGIIVVFPLLGHATWHAYRQVYPD